ncbi:B3 domain-containing protein Os01g0234100-like isoform X1 [Prosopis cineraria]|uniref:B3 domain-containing protein Os01g0234100-like isoform X1 n=1 Tax=Prosopis cineraria TaxID=364024 RepID=UPI00240FFE67|nr:B3 domain-containing protein Os01g0234100-like isoform X1 [Prosopis cineraria]
MVRNQYKLLGIQKKHSDSIPSQGASDQAQQLASSTKVASDKTLSAGEARSSAVFRAEMIQSKLDPRFPSFVKSLVRSHVAGCFWMGLPAFFCKRHLPDNDTTVTLEDESGKGYQLKYIACKTGLSAGWRQFSAAHKLQEGDVLVFQLVEPSKFKVYIVRANGLSELDGAVSLPNLDDHTKQKARDNANKDALPSNSPKRKQQKSDLPPPVVQKKKKTNASRISPKVRQRAEHCEYESDEAGSEVLESFGREVKFKDVRGFENFSIIVDGIPIDSELPHEVRNKYYKLCHSQQAFLHDNLIKGINYNLLVGIVSEVVNIADALRSSSLHISPTEFAKWDKELLAFEFLGMNVEFLRHRLCRLVNLAYETQDASETSRHSESTAEFSRADNEIMNIETKLEELKEACDGFGSYIESLRYKGGRFHH